MKNIENATDSVDTDKAIEELRDLYNQLFVSEVNAEIAKIKEQLEKELKKLSSDVGDNKRLIRDIIPTIDRDVRMPIKDGIDALETKISGLDTTLDESTAYLFQKLANVEKEISEKITNLATSISDKVAAELPSHIKLEEIPLLKNLQSELEKIKALVDEKLDKVGKEQKQVAEDQVDLHNDLVDEVRANKQEVEKIYNSLNIKFELSQNQRRSNFTIHLIFYFAIILLLFALNVIKS